MVVSRALIFNSQYAHPLLATPLYAMSILTPDPTHRIYRRSPESRELFGRVNVADMESPLYHAHVLRVANGFDDLLNKLHNHKVLDSMLSHLAEAHAVRNGLKKVYFEVSFNIYVHIIMIYYIYILPVWLSCQSRQTLNQLDAGSSLGTIKIGLNIIFRSDLI